MNCSPSTASPSGDIAGRLGYHDAPAFSRAYRRWTGSTPGRSRTPTSRSDIANW
ncbi:helix-turn-helix domain-containing protein [Nocardia sp. NPDC050710]|uniref:helix-turn-helix domain-containing protein n=1 Tax=Nocardia sp. NPDC050710 TaxID=3157220 RepID=UPI0033C08476